MRDINNNNINKILIEEKIDNFKNNIKELKEQITYLSKKLYENENVEKIISLIIPILSKLSDTLQLLSNSMLDIFVIQGDVNKIDNLLENINDKIESIETDIKLMIEDLKDKIDVSDFNSLLKDINQKINQLEKEIDKINLQIKNNYELNEKKFSETDDNIIDLYTKISDLNEQTKQLFKLTTDIKDNFEKIKSSIDKSKLFRQRFIQSIVLLLLSGSSILGLLLKLVLDYYFNKR